MKQRQQPLFVTLGGGTGTFPVITALRELPCKIACIVTVADSGGSTGRIRDEFGFQPVGDLRQSLAALALSNQKWVQKLLLYRFSQGDGLKGHNLGNLILTALQDMSGSTTQALERAAQLFGLEGSVIPATEDVVDLKIHYADGSIVVGEHTLDEPLEIAAQIEQVSLTPQCTLNPAAAQTIQDAQYLAIGPGDYYASIHAALAVPGIAQAIKNSQAKLLYIGNLMTRYSQTNGMSASDHVTKLEEKIGRAFDTIILHEGEISKTLLERYARAKEYPVADDLGSDPRVIRTDLLHEQEIKQDESDAVSRSVLRHSYDKLKTVFTQLLIDAKTS